MKIFKLIQNNHEDNTIIFNARDLPEARLRDIVAVYHPELSHSTHLLTQVRVEPLADDQQQPKDTIGLSANFIKTFTLKLHKDICVHLVPHSDVSVTLLEITFKEQYWGRPDMWDVRNQLCGECVYRGQRIKCFGTLQQIAYVDDLWAEGERRACGYITPNTLVTYRSLTAQVNIFVQMSSEMWTFDRYGYLNYEKAAAFLGDLFRLWTRKASNHDVTLTLFSRLFYDANSMDDFPESMRTCIMVDCRGRFYEDFYHVVVQNERCDDWSNCAILHVLKTLFENYESYIVRYHESEPPYQNPTKSHSYKWNVSAVKGVRPEPQKKSANESGKPHIPKAWNSSAAEGNMLEVLNLGLNVFEKYYVDRSFDRTSKVSIVLSPGNGVFEVDRSLASITKQRTIDCGSSSDLVCLAPQPQHAVPLFVFPAAGVQNENGGFRYDDYNIPEWISHCYYTCEPELHMEIVGDFVTRCAEHPGREPRSLPLPSLPPQLPLSSLKIPFDYDAHDSWTFRPPKLHVKLLQGPNSNNTTFKRLRMPSLTTNAVKTMLTDTVNNATSLPVDIPPQKRTAEVFLSDSFGGSHTQFPLNWKPGSIMMPVAHFKQRPVFGRPLVNPFTQVKLHIKMTSNTRRWTHAFPMNPSGKAVQPHHQLTITRIETGSSTRDASPAPQKEQSLFGSDLKQLHATWKSGRRMSESSSASGHGHGQLRHGIPASPQTVRDSGFVGGSRVSTIRQENGLRRTESSSSIVDTSAVGSYSSSIGIWINTVPRHTGSVSDSINTEGPGCYWGATSNQEWTLEKLTGMDWKSLAYPPLLPLTTDFFPERRSLDNEYVTSNYTVIPEDMCIGLDMRRCGGKVTASLVFVQMILQRLAQGFQIVLPPYKTSSLQQIHPMLGVRHMAPGRKSGNNSGAATEEIVLSMGRIYHMLTLCEPNIRVKSYAPRHPFQRMSYQYRYRFRVPDSPPGFDSSWTEFRWDPLELYRWNYVDQYLSTYGEDHSFTLNESLKYWRARFVLIHLIDTGSAARLNLTSLEGQCDVFWVRNQYNHVLLLEAFLRFLEAANKLKRTTKGSFSRRNMLMNYTCVVGTCDPLSIFFNAVVDKGHSFLPSAPPNKVIKNPTGDKTSEIIDSLLWPESLASPPEISSSDMEERVQQAVREVRSGNWIQWVHTKVDGTSPRKMRKWLTRNSERADVIRALTSSTDGLSFVQAQPNTECPPLPEYCFISIESVLWALRAVEGVTTLADGINYMQHLLDEGWIRHASGRRTPDFVYGFYLYFVVTAERGSLRSDPGYVIDDNFEWEWCEVSMSHTTSRLAPAYFNTFADGPPVAQESETGGDRPQRQHKLVNVNADPHADSGREQWGEGCYHTSYNPDTAFELIVSWLVASGPILGELLLSWSRRASSYGLHFLPIPSRPFMLPFMTNADPLRAPIYVPLNMHCLGNGIEMLSEFPESTRYDRLLLLQCSIVDLFGFILDRPRRPDHVAGVVTGWAQFVHCTGGMLVMIPQLGHRLVPNSRQCDEDEQVYRDYIASQCRFLGFGNVTGHDENLPPGFLWSWNFLFNKRWRNLLTGDEVLQDRMLNDFRRFCSGEDGRLQAHYRRASAIGEAYRKFTSLLSGGSTDSTVTNGIH